MTQLNIHNTAMQGIHLPTANTHVLLIQAPQGLLGCGYFNVEVADRVGDALAVVTGVSNFEQMRHASVVRVSQAAIERGVREGMSGDEALKQLI